MARLARCCCGSLRAEVSAEPVFVAACHCEQCQRRTGSAFGISAYFPAEAVRMQGAAAVFERDSQGGRKVRMHFCPTCGTTVYWQADFSPGHIGVAVGAFFEPDFPPPRLSAWERSKHPWVTFECDTLRLARQEPPPAPPEGARRAHRKTDIEGATPGKETPCGSSARPARSSSSARPRMCSASSRPRTTGSAPTR